MKHLDLVNWLRYRTKFLSPMNDFEIAMIIADMKFLPGRITGRHPPFTEQIRIELTATYDVGFDDDGNEIPTKTWPIY